MRLYHIFVGFFSLLFIIIPNFSSIFSLNHGVYKKISFLI